MKADENNEMQTQKAHDFLKDVQYQNAVFAIRQIETDRDGLTLREIWEETEKLRERLLGVEGELRDSYLIDWLPNPEKAYGGTSKHPVRTQMCILILFALRLIKAERDQEKNPHREIIRAIVRLVGERAKQEAALMEDLRRLIRVIDQDGDANEAKGKVVEFGVDILQQKNWSEELRTIVERYKKEAYEAGIIANKALFESIWEALLQDNWFVAEMRAPSLEQPFNLRLLFNVYGMIFRRVPSVYYASKIRGGQSLAKRIGEKEGGRPYSKDYFNDTTHFDRFCTIMTNNKIG
ncbi:MAG: hypothetical protein MR544_00505 [Parabacteroides sp.]|nr:hypothetical protein [Parabacteroides sp.]